MNLQEALSEQGLRLRSYREGSSKILCPRCSHTRKNKTEPCLSVTIDAKGATWLCHHCLWAGAANEGAEPVRHAKRRYPVKPEHKTGSLPANVVEWFGRRGINAAVLERNGVGYEQTWMPGCADGEKTGAITFPFMRGGEVVNVKYRTGAKQFRQVKDAEKIYYGLDDITGQSIVIICEGELDKLSLEVAAFVNAVSVPDGAPKAVKDATPDEDDDTKFSYVWNCRDAFESVSKIILATDGDPPGEALAEELARRYGKHRCWRVTWPNGNDVVCKDANDVLVHHGAHVLREVIEQARPYPIKSLYDANAFETDVLRLYRGETAKAYSTGWSALDPLYKVRAGELTVVTGVPNAGKSQWVDALAVGLAERHGWRFGVCSFENPPAYHIAKLSELYMRAPFADGPTRRMSEIDVQNAMGWLQERFFFIRAEDESPTIDWIIETARAAVMRHGITGLVIDPYNEVEHHRGPSQTETEYVSEILSKVKRFAQAHGVHVWFVAHPAKLFRDRDGKMPVPTLYDISGSANWVNKADVGVVIERDVESNRVNVHVRKVRWKEVGRIGVATLEFDRVTGRYSDSESIHWRGAASA